MESLDVPAEEVLLPAYDDLPLAPLGGRSAWGLFGPEDNIGLVNLLTAPRIAEAARLVRRGAMFSLNASLDHFNPPFGGHRGVPRHRVLHGRGEVAFDDVYDNFYPQVSSQWDALGHEGYTSDSFYNGATESDVFAGKRCTIEHWARHG